MERKIIMKQRLKNLSFYKKKPFYIVLVVLFSLMLLADIAIAVFVPTQSGDMYGNRQNMEMWGSFGGDMDSESGDSTDTYTDTDEGNTDDGMNFGDMPSGGDFESGDMPSGGDFDSSDMPSGGDFDSSDMPSMDENTDFDFSDMQDEIEEIQSENTGFLQTVKSHWLIIFIILLVLDAASIFMLLWISHKEKKQKVLLEEEEKQQRADGEVHIARPVKKKKHSPLLWIIPVAAVILLIVIVKMLSRGSSTEVSETEATVYSATAELSDISTVLPGAGTLTEETAEELTLASDVEISKWYVSNGDTVEEGDVLASVDKVSVMTAIASVQEIITELDEELLEHEDEEISDEITAGADGRVMAVYATEDASVVDVMYEYSSLMLISLDGSLAVEIETDADISAGDAVVVTLSDGTEIDGKVESFINGTTVILVSDEDAALDDEVSVTTEDGSAIGTGSLYIHSELKVTGFTGTISDVEVSVGDEVSSEDTLITLDDTEYTGEYDTLIAQRNELEEEIQELIKIYQDGYIYASCNGVISGLEDDTASDNEDEDSDTSSDEEETESQALSDDTGNSSGGIIAAVSVSTTSSDKNSGIALDSTGFTLTAASAGSENDDYVNYVGIVTSVNEGTASVKLIPDTYSIEDYTDISDINIDEQNMTVETTVDLSSAKVVFKSSDGVLTVDSLSSVAENDILILAFDADDEDSLVFVVRVVESDTEEKTEEGMTGEESGQSDMTGGETEQSEMTDVESGQNAGTDGETGMDENETEQITTDSSFAQNSSGTTVSQESDTTDATDEVQVSYTVSETTLLSITPQKTMTITITIDELDILSLETGQEALVTLDAFPGQSFEGEVTSIDTSGTNSGGSTKFTAEITINREENMLAGMNASVVITLDTKEGVLSVPEAALVEENGRVYVYTGYDEESETLEDLTEVTTGVSDGENVEILSGLSEGSEFYYSYLDVVNYSSSSSSSSGSMGVSFDSMFGGGR